MLHTRHHRTTMSASTLKLSAYDSSISSVTLYASSDSARVKRDYELSLPHVGLSPARPRAHVSATDWVGSLHSPLSPTSS